MANKPARQEPQSTPVQASKPVLPPGVARDIIAATHTSTFEHVVHHGPLPDPAQLKQYNEVLVGAAERIFSMAERDQAHHQDLQKRVVEGRLSAIKRGQLSALIIGLAGMGCGTWLISNGHKLEGLASLFVPLGVLVGVYLYQQRKPEPAKPTTPKPAPKV